MCGDIIDLHNYPNPEYYLKVKDKVNILGEFGGMGLEIKGHIWIQKNWGYILKKSKEELSETYIQYCKELKNKCQEGLAGAIFTQTSDVEIDINGLVTYDRKIVKVNENLIKSANDDLIKSLSE